MKLIFVLGIILNPTQIVSMWDSSLDKEKCFVEMRTSTIHEIPRRCSTVKLIIEEAIKDEEGK